MAAVHDNREGEALPANELYESVGYESVGFTEAYTDRGWRKVW